MRNRRIHSGTHWPMNLLSLGVQGRSFWREGSSELGPGGQKEPRAQWGRVWASDSLPMHQNHQELLNSLWSLNSPPWNLNSSPWNLDSIYLERSIFKSSRWVSGIKIQGHHQYHIARVERNIVLQHAWSILLSRSKGVKENRYCWKPTRSSQIFLKKSALENTQTF